LYIDRKKVKTRAFMIYILVVICHSISYVLF